MVKYSQDQRRKAKQAGTALATVDVRSPYSRRASDTIVSTNRTEAELAWFFKFAKAVLVDGTTPVKAFNYTYGHSRCPTTISGKPRPPKKHQHKEHTDDRPVANLGLDMLVPSQTADDD